MSDYYGEYGGYGVHSIVGAGGYGYAANANAYQQQQQQQQQLSPGGYAQVGGNGYYGNQPQQAEHAQGYSRGVATAPSGYATSYPAATPTAGGGAAATYADPQNPGAYYGHQQQHAQAQQQPQMQPQYSSNGGYDYGVAAAGGGQPQQEQQQQDPYATTTAAAQEATLAVPNAVDASGLRWTWSTYPNTTRVKAKEHASAASIPLPEMVIPLGCMYAPLQPQPLEALVLDDPQALPAGAGQQMCGNCGAFWCRHCHRVEGQPGKAGSWVCASCQRLNQLPAGFSPHHPAMLYDTVEYLLPDAVTAGTGIESDDVVADEVRRPVFIFAVDTCLPHEEITALKTNLKRSLAWLPPRSLVGFISFGARTTVWELNASASAGLSKCYALRGDAAYTAADMPQMLQVSDSRPVRGRFLCSLESCQAVLSALMEELQSDGAPQRSNRRPLRTTGTAVGVATFLMESLRQHTLEWSSGNGGAAAGGRGGVVPIKTSGKILLFTGGPCTRGLGMIVGTDKAEMMRFHRDIIDGDTPYYTKAHTFYNELDKRLAAVDGCLDVFAQSFDQVGVMEMRNCVNNTGGTFVCGDSFDHENFAISLERYFERCDLRIRERNEHANTDSNIGAAGDDSYTVRCAFGVHLEVHTSADTLVSGVLGPCNVDEEANKGRIHRAASPVQIGLGGSTRFCVSSLDQGVTLAFLFDTATLDGSGQQQQQQQQQHHRQQQRFVQFVTRYVTPTGQRRIRVTSVAQPVAPTTATAEYYVQCQAFDQTCASTLIARMAVSILERFPNRWDDAKRWVDTLLVQFVRRYGTFSPNIPESLRLDPCLSLFPSFMFNLRRSEYFIVLNISPDETTFKRHWLTREAVDNCVLMIQPTLDSYDLEAPYAAPVPLDSSSLRHDNIVLMDAFFNVHIMWGTTIYDWIEAKYHELPDYAHFAELLETAEADAQAVLARRYPYPRFSRTSANGSEARHVKTRVNPAMTHHQQPGGMLPAPGGADDRSDLIYTDDASIAKFMASLKQAVVTPEPKDSAMNAIRRK